jgi:hypothetical protein
MGFGGDPNRRAVFSCMEIGKRVGLHGTLLSFPGLVFVSLTPFLFLFQVTGATTLHPDAFPHGCTYLTYILHHSRISIFIVSAILAKWYWMRRNSWRWNLP